MSPQGHIPSSTCQLMCGFFLHKSHYMCEMCVLMDAHFIFCASFCVSNVKKRAKTLSEVHMTSSIWYGDDGTIDESGISTIILDWTQVMMH